MIRFGKLPMVVQAGPNSQLAFAQQQRQGKNGFEQHRPQRIVGECNLWQ